MPSRRSVLVGLGGLVVGGGALIGTGAFTTVEAQRTVDINTSGDASAFLGLSPAERDNDTDSSPESGNEYVSTPGTGTISIDLDGTDGDASGLNQDAITTFRNLIKITNNGTQDIISITLEFTDVPSEIVDNTSIDNTFDFTVSTTGSDGGDDSDQVQNGNNILTGNNNVPSALTPGDDAEFGIVVDLINGGDGSNNLPGTDDTNDGYTLTITAETGSTSTATPPSGS